MLTYTTIQNRPREFLAATGLTHAEFARLLPAFATAYAALYPSDQTMEGKPRQRRVGGGATGALPQMEGSWPLLVIVARVVHMQRMDSSCSLRVCNRPQTS